MWNYNSIMWTFIGVAGPGLLAEAFLYLLTGGLVGWQPFVAALAGGVGTLGLLRFWPSKDRQTYSRRTPQELMSEVQGLTTVQQLNVVRRHKGTWLQVEGKVADVAPISGSSTYLVQVRLPIGNARAALVFRTFSLMSSQKKKLDILNNGDNIVVTGKIDNIKAGDIHLTNCKLEE